MKILIDMEADTWVKLLVQESLVPQPGFATGEPDVLSPGIQKELQGKGFFFGTFGNKICKNVCHI